MKRVAWLLVIGLAGAAGAVGFQEHSADEEYESTIARIESEAAQRKRKAVEKRVGIYRDAMRSATKSGDLDRALAIRERLEQFAAGVHWRERPKNVARFAGHSYALISDPPATWHVASRRCEEMGGYLACVASAKELEFIAALCGNTPAWVGASDEEREGEWHWINGEPVKGEWPADNSHGFEHCLAYSPPTRNWNDWPAGARLAYVCEWND